MKPTDRVVQESPFYQGADEQIAYVITIPTSWGTASLSSLSSKIYSVSADQVTYTDTTTTNMSGSTTASSQVITTPIVKSLTAGTEYRVEVKFTTSEGNICEFYFFVKGVR